LVPLVYDELYALAHRNMRRERPDHTLQTTALVNEAWLKLSAQTRMDWQNRQQFFGVAASLMRRILTDHARELATVRRGGHARRVHVAGTEELALDAPVDMLTLEDALTDLERLDPMQCRLVELRFFAGLTMEEVAEILGFSLSKAKLEWRMVRAWLFDYLHTSSS